MTWFISQKLMVQQTVSNRGVRIRGKTIELYNKNGMCWYRFRNARKCACHFGWLADRNSCPDYFSRVIVPEKQIHTERG